jgi:hypothetical protein
MLPSPQNILHPNYTSLHPRHPRRLSRLSDALSVPPSPRCLSRPRAACSAAAGARRRRWSTGGGRGRRVAGRCAEDRRRGREAIGDRQEGEPLGKGNVPPRRRQEDGVPSPHVAAAHAARGGGRMLRRRRTTRDALHVLCELRFLPSFCSLHYTVGLLSWESNCQS